RRADPARLLSLQPLQHADAAVDRADVRGRARERARARGRTDMTIENRQPERPHATDEPAEPRASDALAVEVAESAAPVDAEQAETVAPAAPFDPSAAIKHLTHKPGVYRMLDAASSVIYVGKARDLRRRVTSYFQGSRAH